MVNWKECCVVASYIAAINPGGFLSLSAVINPKLRCSALTLRPRAPIRLIHCSLVHRDYLLGQISAWHVNIINKTLWRKRITATTRLRPRPAIGTDTQVILVLSCPARMRIFQVTRISGWYCAFTLAGNTPLRLRDRASVCTGDVARPKYGPSPPHLHDAP